MGTFTESHELEHHANQQKDLEILALKDQLKFYKEKVNRAYLFAETLDGEAQVGVWTDTKEAKMACACRLRIILEG
jgi:hypothetical protein